MLRNRGRVGNLVSALVEGDHARKARLTRPPDVSHETVFVCRSNIELFLVRKGWECTDI